MLKSAIFALTAAAAANAAAVNTAAGGIQLHELVLRTVPEASAAGNNAAGAGLGGFPTLAQPGCDNQCKPWLDMINADPCFTAETCPNSELMQTGKRICENLDSIAACGYCNVAADDRNAVSDSIKKTFDACQNAYGVPAKLPAAPEVKEVASSTQSVKEAETSKAAAPKESQTSKAAEAPKASEPAKAADASKQEKSGAVARTASIAAVAVGFAMALMI